MIRSLQIALTLSLIVVCKFNAEAQYRAVRNQEPLIAELRLYKTEKILPLKISENGSSARLYKRRPYSQRIFPVLAEKDKPFGAFGKPANLPEVYDYDHLGFFCKWEVKLQQATRWPVKFRLGDVDYVDWLEGKRDSY